MLYHEDMPFAECCQLLEFARQEEAGLVFKFPQHMYIYQHPEKVDWLQGQMNSDIGSEPFIFHPEQDRHYLELPQCASIHADPERIKAFAQHSTLSFRQFSEYGFDVAPQGVNKGSGIRRLLSLLDLPRSQCACFGDNYNDIEMMESCGFRVAMGNAVPEIKAMADHVTTATDEDGRSCLAYSTWASFKKTGTYFRIPVLIQSHTSEAVPPPRSAFFLRLPAP